MSGAGDVIERTFVATFGDLAPPSPDEPEISEGIGIHSTDGARSFGFDGALVIGVNLYARSVPSILEAVGEEWLDDGWIEVRWRRPTLPGTELRLRISPSEDRHTLELAPPEQDACMVGEFGLGDAPWLGDYRLSRNLTPAGRPVRIFPEDPPQGSETFDLAAPPVGRELRTMAFSVSDDEARAFGRKYAHQAFSEVFTGEAPVVHPTLVASAMVYGLYHSFRFGDEHQGMAVGYRIQNLRRPVAGREFVLTGHLTDMYERKGNHYAVHDGALFDTDGVEYARLRHTVVVHLRETAG